MAKLHASLSPNVLNLGETLKLQFDGSTDSDQVVVKVFEVDEQSPLEPKGEDKLVVTAQGKLEKNVFTLSSDPVMPKASATVPKIVLELGGKSFDVPLPDATSEQGMFELRLVAESQGKASAKFTTPKTVLVRCFRHFQVDGTPRPVIAFVTGADNAGFFESAGKFWKLNADVVVKQEGMSLQAIVDFLDTHGKSLGPWGQINIVAHGRERLIFINLFPGVPGEKAKNLHRDQLDGELDAFEKTGKKWKVPKSIDDETQVAFRACNAGRDQELLERIKNRIFPSAKFVKVPKFVQRYEFAGSKVKELFEESLGFDEPTKEQALARLQPGLRAAFPELQTRSPGLGPGATAAAEVPSFDDNHDFELPLGELDLLAREADIFGDTGKLRPSAELVKVMRDKWQEQKYHQLSQTWETDEDRWTLKLDRHEVDAKETDGRKEVLFERTAGAGSPRFMQIDSGGFGIGSGTVDDGDMWTLKAEGLAELHAVVSVVDGKTIEVQGGAPDVEVVIDDASGSRTLKGTNKRTAKLPATLTLGGVKIAVRRGRIFKLVFTGSRFFVDRRRRMMIFDAKVPYGERKKLVVPNLDDSRHYGTAE